jgi:hypothetical protein
MEIEVLGHIVINVRGLFHERTKGRVVSAFSATASA